MNILNIAGTEDTPSIILNNDTKEYTFSGRSLPEDVTTFYHPVIEWLGEFAGSPASGAKFNFKLEYFNTASSKILLDILMQLEEINDNAGGNFIIVWHYQESDPDMKEAGEEYADIVSIPFEFVNY
jgi:SiaC family regulatory phosphoprotein